mgnify:CR=1 FL=1
MKKIICSINPFNLYQSIQIADTGAGTVEEVAKVPSDDLEEMLASISYENNISQIILSGHPLVDQMAKDIIEYSKETYDKNTKLKVEVIK